MANSIYSSARSTLYIDVTQYTFLVNGDHITKVPVPDKDQTWTFTVPPSGGDITVQTTAQGIFYVT